MNNWKISNPTRCWRCRNKWTVTLIKGSKLEFDRFYCPYCNKFWKRVKYKYESVIGS